MKLSIYSTQMTLLALFSLKSTRESLISSQLIGNQIRQLDYKPQVSLDNNFQYQQKQPHKHQQQNHNSYYHNSYYKPSNYHQKHYAYLNQEENSTLGINYNSTMLLTATRCNKFNRILNDSTKKGHQTEISSTISYLIGNKSSSMIERAENHQQADSGVGDIVNAQKYNFNTQEATATAMVGLVRLILVILICVLLVKLRSPMGANKYSSSKRKSHEDEYEQTIRYEKNFDDLEQQQNIILASEQKSSFDFRKLINFTNQLCTGEPIVAFGDATRRQLQRRKSQPELNFNSSSSSSQVTTRRRRHSDTSLTHLKLPPGPMGLPFLGYLPFVGSEIHLTLTSLSERYGPIYQIYLGGIRVVVLNDASLVRQAFKQPVFSGRPDTQLTRILQGYGIVNSEGALWKEQRAFLHSALRKLGAKSLMNGSNGLEAKIQNQVREFVSDLSIYANEAKPCQVRPIVARAVSSVVGSIVMNLTYRKYEEKEKFDRLIELMQEGFRLFTIAMPLDFIPIFRFLPGVSYAYKKMKRNRAETSAFFQGVADEHRRYLSDTFNLGASSSTSSLHPRSMSGLAAAAAASAAANAAAISVSNSTEAVETATGNGNLVKLAPVVTTQQLVQLTTKLPEQQQQQRQQPDDQITSSLYHKQTNLLAGKNKEQVNLDSLEANQVNLDSVSSMQQKVSAMKSKECTVNLIEKEQRPIELENIVARDLVDAYLVQQKKHENDGRENYFSDQQLVQIMSDIFSAGLETVTSTIEWSILFLILNTECQDKIHDEIDRIIGRERSPQLDDLAHMPYTEATIYEVLRRSNVVALGNAHATLADASIAGYRIPKGTQVLPNLYGIHMNPKLWNQPNLFDPSRFIVNERAHKPDYFMPFSVGRRMCLGDVLTKMEVFLFLVGLLQKYDLSVADEDRLCPPQVKGTIGVSNAPVSFKVKLSWRKEMKQTN